MNDLFNVIICICISIVYSKKKKWLLNLILMFLLIIKYLFYLCKVVFYVLELLILRGCFVWWTVLDVGVVLLGID